MAWAERHRKNRLTRNHPTANTSRLHRTCVFTPASAKDVSEAVKLFERHDCKFAVRVGGHTPNSGASNIEKGVLMAMTKLDELSLHSDSVSVGAGLRWKDVFNFLAPDSLTVVGGRAGAVGVAGLTTGCGLSTRRGYEASRHVGCTRAETLVLTGSS